MSDIAPFHKIFYLKPSPFPERKRGEEEPVEPTKDAMDVDEDQDAEGEDEEEEEEEEGAGEDGDGERGAISSDLSEPED